MMAKEDRQLLKSSISKSPSNRASGPALPPATQTLKYVCLATLTIQNAAFALSMRYARSRPVENMFIASTAVLLTEALKLLISLYFVSREEKSSSSSSCPKSESTDSVGLVSILKTHILYRPLESLKVGVPALIYVIQNNLLYISAGHLDAATYQVTYQSKILTTALFSVILLKRKLFQVQWLALLILLFGVVLVNLSGVTESSKAKASSNLPPNPSPTVIEIEPANVENRLYGLLAAIGASLCSGFAGVFFELILKGASVSIWIRNVQLALLSLPCAGLTMLLTDGAKISKLGFFYGYDAFVWYLVILQAIGGLLVGMVVKYADNILKGFATSLAIVISCLFSVLVFSLYLNLTFCLGTTLVISSIFLYGSR